MSSSTRVPLEQSARGNVPPEDLGRDISDTLEDILAAYPEIQAKVARLKDAKAAAADRERTLFAAQLQGVSDSGDLEDSTETTDGTGFLHGVPFTWTKVPAIIKEDKPC